MPTPSYLPVSFDTSALVPQQRLNGMVKGPSPALLPAAVLLGDTLGHPLVQVRAGGVSACSAAVA